jgi:solute carrier family 30 (zinc transporter), member 1
MNNNNPCDVLNPDDAININISARMIDETKNIDRTNDMTKLLSDENELVEIKINNDNTCESTMIDQSLHTHSKINESKFVKVKHGDHYDVLIGNRLHHVHGDHCDDHGYNDDHNDRDDTDDDEIEQKKENEIVDKSRLSSKSLKSLWRFILMGFLTGSFFVIELVVGIMIGSIALQADAFHMLSDLVALGMACYATSIVTKKETDKATFGMSRAEVIGGLVNSVFLLASCFFIALEVIQRFFEFEESHVQLAQIDLLMIVGGVGLGINFIGMIIFGICGDGSHGHSHGGHGHSHGGHGHSHGGHGHSHGGDAHNHGHNHGHDHGHNESNNDESKKQNKNIRALFLHIMGDALGSIGVIASGLIIKYVDSEYRYLSDPLISLFIIFLILGSAIPLVRECIHILMHKVPLHIDLKTIRKTIYSLKGVQDVHHLHVWQIDDAKIIASLHIKIDEFVDIDNTVIQVEKLFHDAGVHSTTIQVEIVSYDRIDNNLLNSGRNKIEIAECVNIICGHARCTTDVCCNSK